MVWQTKNSFTHGRRTGPFFPQILYLYIYPKMLLLSFEDIQKIRIFPKFEGCCSKTVRTKPISILNFSRVWQSYFLKYVLEILITYGFFVDKKMMFYSFFCIFNRQAEILENCFFFSGVAPKWYVIVHNHGFLYHCWGNTLEKKKMFS